MLPVSGANGDAEWDVNSASRAAPIVARLLASLMHAMSIFRAWMGPMNPHLFVYGSLISSIAHPMGERLRAEARLLAPARLKGRLYKVSWYPGVVTSADPRDWVHGEVYRLADPAAALRWLDEYEGVSHGPQSVAPREEYARIETPVALDAGATLVAWVYLYQRSVDGLTRIESGRWSTAAPPHPRR